MSLSLAVIAVFFCIQPTAFIFTCNFHLSRYTYLLFGCQRKLDPLRRIRCCPILRIIITIRGTGDRNSMIRRREYFLKTHFSSFRIMLGWVFLFCTVDIISAFLFLSYRWNVSAGIFLCSCRLKKLELANWNQNNLDIHETMLKINTELLSINEYYWTPMASARSMLKCNFITDFYSRTHLGRIELEPFLLAPPLPRIHPTSLKLRVLSSQIACIFSRMEFIFFLIQTKVVPWKIFYIFGTGSTSTTGSTNR